MVRIMHRILQCIYLQSRTSKLTIVGIPTNRQKWRSDIAQFALRNVPRTEVWFLSSVKMAGDDLTCSGAIAIQMAINNSEYATCQLFPWSLSLWYCMRILRVQRSRRVGFCRVNTALPRAALGRANEGRGNQRPGAPFVRSATLTHCSGARNKAPQTNHQHLFVTGAPNELESLL